MPPTRFGPPENSKVAIKMFTNWNIIKKFKNHIYRNFKVFLIYIHELEEYFRFKTSLICGATHASDNSVRLAHGIVDLSVFRQFSLWFKLLIDDSGVEIGFKVDICVVVVVVVVVVGDGVCGLL